MIFDASNAASLLERWGQIVESSPRELDSFLYAFAPHDSTPIARLVSIYASDDTEAAVEALTPLLQIGPLLDQQAQLIPYAAIAPRTTASTTAARPSRWSQTASQDTSPPS
jgi:hypothetical protein